MSIKKIRRLKTLGLFEKLTKNTNLKLIIKLLSENDKCFCCHLLAKFDLVYKLLVKNFGTCFGEHVFFNDQKFGVLSHHN